MSVTELGYSAGLVVTEIGSGLNGHRSKLMKLLANPEVKIIAVEHRERLMRFGSEYVESALAAQNRRILVIGRRAARNRAKKAVEGRTGEG